MTAIAHHSDHDTPEIRVFRNPDGWTLPYLEPGPQDCTTNHNGTRDDREPCTATAVWKVVELYDLHATFSFWCDNELPTEHRPATTPAV